MDLSTNSEEVDKFCRAILLLLTRKNERSYDDSFLSRLSSYINELPKLKLAEICNEKKLLEKIFDLIPSFTQNIDYSLKISNSIYLQIIGDLLSNSVVFDRIFLNIDKTYYQRFIDDCGMMIELFMKPNSCSDLHIIHCCVEMLNKIFSHDIGIQLIWCEVLSIRWVFSNIFLDLLKNNSISIYLKRDILKLIIRVTNFRCSNKPLSDELKLKSLFKTFPIKLKSNCSYEKEIEIVLSDFKTQVEILNICQIQEENLTKRFREHVYNLVTNLIMGFWSWFVGVLKCANSKLLRREIREICSLFKKLNIYVSERCTDSLTIRNEDFQCFFDNAVLILKYDPSCYLSIFFSIIHRSNCFIEHRRNVAFNCSHGFHVNLYEGFEDVFFQDNFQLKIIRRIYQEFLKISLFNIKPEESFENDQRYRRALKNYQHVNISREFFHELCQFNNIDIILKICPSTLQTCLSCMDVEKFDHNMDILIIGYMMNWFELFITTNDNIVQTRFTPKFAEFFLLILKICLNIVIKNSYKQVSIVFKVLRKLFRRSNNIWTIKTDTYQQMQNLVDEFIKICIVHLKELPLDAQTEEIEKFEIWIELLCYLIICLVYSEEKPNSYQSLLFVLKDKKFHFDSSILSSNSKANLFSIYLAIDNKHSEESEIERNDFFKTYLTIQNQEFYHQFIENIKLYLDSDFLSPERLENVWNLLVDLLFHVYFMFRDCDTEDYSQLLSMIHRFWFVASKEQKLYFVKSQTLRVCDEIYQDQSVGIAVKEININVVQDMKEFLSQLDNNDFDIMNSVFIKNSITLQIDKQTMEKDLLKNCAQPILNLFDDIIESETASYNRMDCY